MTAGLDGKVALVTGGGRGIGRAIVVELATCGAAVAVNYRLDREAAQRTVDEVRAAGGRAIATPADVSDEEQVRSCVAAVHDELGSIDVLVNNAGLSRLTPPAQLGAKEWRAVLRVNLDGPFHTTWAVKDEMLARGSGSIVNVASVAGIVPTAEQIHYGTAKAALIHFTRTCAKAFAPSGVRVNCVAPGFTWTDRVATVDPAAVERIIAGIPMGRGAAPEEIASVVRFLASDDASYVTGQVVAACGGRT
jgi:3-oxoacyl-[acyl-carrier protein] reductase